MIWPYDNSSHILHFLFLMIDAEAVLRNEADLRGCKK